MKPLIDAIPKRTVRLADKDYEIYNCISVSIQREAITFCTYCSANGRQKQCKATISKDSEKMHQRIVSRLENISDAVERNYYAKYALPISDLLPHFRSYFKLPEGNKYLHIDFPVLDIGTGKKLWKSKCLGNISYLNQADIDAGIKGVEECQLIMNTQYNVLAKKHNKELLETIEHQIKQRDRVYYQKKYI